MVHKNLGLLRSFNQAFPFEQARASYLGDPVLQMMLESTVHNHSFPGVNRLGIAPC
jgi:hypothetical protein